MRIPSHPWKSFANGAQLSHIPTGPAVIQRTLLNPRGGPNQMIKSGPDRVDKPTCQVSEPPENLGACAVERF